MDATDPAAVSVPLLVLEEVTQHYGAPAGRGTSILDRVSIRVGRGDSIAIVGPSGSGKSTLLNILGGLMKPTQGHVRLEGVDLATLSADELARVRNRRIGFVFQSHHLLPQLTALENALLPTVVFGQAARRSELRDRAMALFELVGLQALAFRRPGMLSGGECQRVAIVRALINEPTLLLADEPTGSLDTQSADGLAELLQGLNRDKSLTMIVVTHSDALAQRMQFRYRLRMGMLESVETPG